jgi:alkanesulfonate monooxygenase SsuD/methylene tetrahydromethanopterin reductase-like flavin-dependent oxidoreductase (luciferase family)
VRLGTTSLLISIHEPLRVAAEVATLDQLSGGRAKHGVGRGLEPAMFKAFGIDPRDKRDRFDDALDAILEAWSETRRGAEESDSALQPVQRPHPPIWVAAFGSKGLTQAARRGLPYLASPIESFATLVENFAAHAAQLPAGVERNSLPVAVMRTVHVAADGAEARRVRGSGCRFATRRVRAVRSPRNQRVGNDRERQRRVEAHRPVPRHRMNHLWCGRHRARGQRRASLERIRDRGLRPPRRPIGAPSRVKVTNAIAGRFEFSRIAKWKPSKLQPCATHSLRIRSSSSSATLLVSITL